MDIKGNDTDYTLKSSNNELLITSHVYFNLPIPLCFGSKLLTNFLMHRPLFNALALNPATFLESMAATGAISLPLAKETFA